MGYRPKFRVTPRLSAQIADIAAMREALFSARSSAAPGRDADSRQRKRGRSSGASSDVPVSAGGLPPMLAKVLAMAKGEDFPVVTERRERQVLDQFARWRRSERKPVKGRSTHRQVLQLHKIVAAGEGLDQGRAGEYRSIGVRAGRFVPPPPDKVPRLMRDLLEWWNTKARKLPPVLTSAILHYRISDIHPFADGNGRLARAVALWELYRNGFGRELLALNGRYWGRRRQYYAALRRVSRRGEDLTPWLEYSAERLKQELKREWRGIRGQRPASAR